jgi:hypothetical protein
MFIHMNCKLASFRVGLTDRSPDGHSKSISSAKHKTKHKTNDIALTCCIKVRYFLSCKVRRTLSRRLGVISLLRSCRRQRGRTRPRFAIVVPAYCIERMICSASRLNREINAFDALLRPRHASRESSSVTDGISKSVGNLHHIKPWLRSLTAFPRRRKLGPRR